MESVVMHRFVTASHLFYPPFWDLKKTCFYPASRGFSLAWLLECTKSFAWLVSRVVGLFKWRKQTNYATEKPCERLGKR